MPVGGAKKSGWGDMDGGGEAAPTAPAPRRRRAADEEDDAPQETKISHNPKHDQDSDDDGPAMMIPDLDEEQAEDITRQVAEAPSLNGAPAFMIDVPAAFWRAVAAFAFAASSAALAAVRSTAAAATTSQPWSREWVAHAVAADSHAAGLAAANR